jgi:hypothetical protein
MELVSCNNNNDTIKLIKFIWIIMYLNKLWSAIWAHYNCWQIFQTFNQIQDVTSVSEARLKHKRPVPQIFYECKPKLDIKGRICNLFRIGLCYISQKWLVITIIYTWLEFFFNRHHCRWLYSTWVDFWNRKTHKRILQLADMQWYRYKFYACTV